jgi:hypothetical protein
LLIWIDLFLYSITIIDNFPPLNNSISHPVNFEAFSREIEFRIDDVHKVSDRGAFDDDVVPVLTKHFIDERGSRIDV